MACGSTPRPPLGEHGVGAGQLEQRNFRRAERQGGTRPQLRADAETLGSGDHPAGADILLQPGSNRVDRMRERMPQRHRAFVLAALVSRAPAADIDRKVENHRLRRRSLLDGREIDQRLERGAGLPLRLCGAVELALARTSARRPARECRRRCRAQPWRPEQRWRPCLRWPALSRPPPERASGGPRRRWFRR